MASDQSPEVIVVDEGDLHKYRTEIPNMVDDMGLDPYAFRLYAHFKRVCGQGGVCYQGTARLAEVCKMSPGQISACKKTLVRDGLIRIEKCDPATGQADRIFIIDIWLENMKRYHSSSSGNSGTPGSKRTPLHTVNTPSPHEDPPSHCERTPSPHEDPPSPHETKKNSLKKELFKKEPDKKNRGAAVAATLGFDGFDVPPAPQPPTQGSTFRWEIEPSAANGPAHLVWRIMVDNNAPYPRSMYGMELKAAKDLLEWYSEDVIITHYRRQRASRNGYNLGYLTRDIASLVGKTAALDIPASRGMSGKLDQALADLAADRVRRQQLQ